MRVQAESDGRNWMNEEIGMSSSEWRRGSGRDGRAHGLRRKCLSSCPSVSLYRTEEGDETIPTKNYLISVPYLTIRSNGTKK